MSGEVKRTPKLELAAIELNLTFNCNLTCSYCFVRQKGAGERMSFDTAKNAIDLLLANAVSPVLNITLIGGEPLLEFQLIKQIVPYALNEAGKRNRGVNWSITTNGTLVNEEILAFFAQYGIHILLSMDGGSESHDRYRRTRNGAGTWHQIAQTIPLMKRYQPWLGVRMTVSKEAIDNMSEDFNQLVQLGLNQFIIAPAQGADVWSEEEITRYGRNLMQILLHYRTLKQAGRPIFIEEFEKDVQAYAGWGCRAGSTSLSVAPNGDVSPCSKMLGLSSEAGKWIVGNVNKEINAALLEPFKNPLSCRKKSCWACSRKCTGGCYAVNFEQTGNHFTPSEENCLFWTVNQATKNIARKLRQGAYY